MALPTISPKMLPYPGVIGSQGSPAGALSHPVHQVSNLFRLYLNGGVRYLVGFFNFEAGHTDAPFAVVPQPTGARCYVLPGVNYIADPLIDSTSWKGLLPHITTSGGLWQTIPFRAKKATDSTDLTGFFAISTNQVD
ncbi:MAG: hypothetical protein ACRDQZ_10930 [Mycobacteriales bacterium]